jgi:regulatory protein
VRSSRADPPAPPDAFDAALRLLTARPHSERELRQKLARRRCPPEEIERAMARVRGLGYLDDAAYARALAARRARTRGPALIAAELSAKGVDRDLAREAVAEVTRADQVAAARRLAARSPGVDRRLLMGRLSRRGYPADVVREAVGEPEVE